MPQIDTQDATRQASPAASSTTKAATATKPRKAKPVTSEDAFAVLLAAAGDGNSVTVRISDASAHFGKPRSTFAGWLKQWTKQGRVAVTSKGRNGAEIVFLRKALPAPTVTPSDATDDIPDDGRSVTTNEADSVTDLDANFVTELDATKPATKLATTSTPDGDAGVTSPSSSVVLFRPTKPVAEATKRPRKRHPAKPVPALALPVPEPSTTPDAAASASPATPPPVFRVSLPNPSPNALLAWTVRGFAVAAIGLSVVMVGRHVASTETASAFDWWTLFLVSVLISLLKPVFGTVAEVLFSERRYVAAVLAFAVAVGALSYDSTQLWAFRGGGLEDKAATNQAAIDARERNKARLENLIAEQRQLLDAKPGEVPAIVPTAPARVAAPTGEGPCTRVPAPWLRGKPEPTAPMEFGNCAAEVNAQMVEADLARAKAAQSQAERIAAAAERRAARLAELPALIAEAERALEARPVIAGSDNGAASAAEAVNYLPSMVGVTVASAHGVSGGWVFGFVFLVEVVAVFGFAFANMIRREHRS